MWILWLVVGVIFTISEILYSGFFLIWFAAGAFITIFVSLFTSSLTIQSIIFITISLLLVLTQTKRFSTKLNNSKTLASNVDGLIGKKGVVTKEIGRDHLESGLVKLDGEIWTAISTDNELIEINSLVIVEQIKGVRLIVRKTEN